MTKKAENGRQNIFKLNLSCPGYPRTSLDQGIQEPLHAADLTFCNVILCY